MEDDKDKRLEDGVEYIPSSTEDEDYSSDDYEEPKISEKGVQKSQYQVFLIMTIFVGLIVFMLTMVMVFRVIRKPVENDLGKKNDTTTPIESESPSETATEEPEKDEKKLDALVIRNISNMGRKLDVYDFQNGKGYSFEIDEKTEIKDKYSSAISSSELNVGDVVNAVYYEDNNVLKQLTGNSNSWEKKSISGVTVNKEANSIKVGSDTYMFDNQIVCVYKEQPYDVAKITPNDNVTLKGFSNTLLYAQLNKGHGSITFINKNKINDGVLEIDKDVYIKLSESKNSYEVSEGVHRVMVSGSNIETYILDLNIMEGIVETVDLNNAKPKSGNLVVKTNVEDYSLKINEQVYETGKAIKLEYGRYKISISKDLYKSVEKEIEINQDVVNVQFELEKLVNLGKITVTSDPQGAEVYIDNVHIGVTPITTSVEYGYHTLLVKKAGYLETPAPITIDESEETYNIQLIASMTSSAPKSEATTQPQATQEINSSDDEDED